MKPHHPETLPRPMSNNIVAVFAALLGIGVTSWVSSVWNLKEGNVATAVYLLIGIPTYKLCVLGHAWFGKLRRLRRKYPPTALVEVK
ncbi:MAG: hypothetical protein LH609_03510 [Rudanella sp.]|nr:hypothetical protein [Rudanella sp.]